MQATQSIGGLPPLTPSVRNLLVGAFVLYALELFAANALGLPVYELSWRPFGEGFAPWQLVTRYLVQGPGVLGVVLSAVAVYFFLPTLEGLFSRRQLYEALGAGALGGTVLGVALDLLGLGHGQVMGWSPAVVVLIALFGLRLPDARILLFFVIPVRASLLVWAEGVISFLLLLSSFELYHADWFGTWAGVVGWWFLRGPEARRRELDRRAEEIRSELRRFEVLPGGRQDEPPSPRPPRNRPPDDDVWH